MRGNATISRSFGARLLWAPLLGAWWLLAAVPALAADSAKPAPGPTKLTQYNQQSVDRDALAAGRRDEAIAELAKIIPSFDDGAQKADLTYRLAELYWEKSRYTYFVEFHSYEQALDSWHAAGAKKVDEPKLSTADSEGQKQQAIKLYDQILKQYPDYSRNDEVLFNKASSLYDAGDKKAAVEIYFDLVKRFPKSDFVPDTYLALGEHFFNSGDLARATSAYQKAVQTNKPRTYAFALYKLAWCDYNAQNYPAAVAKFKQVIDFSEAEAKKNDKLSKIQLREEALRDLLLAYSQLEANEEVKDYYANKLDLAGLQGIMTRLAALYDDQGKYELEVQTLRTSLETWPLVASAPKLQAQIVHAYAQESKRDRVRDEVRRLVTLYKPTSAWAVAQGGGASQPAGAAQAGSNPAQASSNPALDDAYALTEKALRELVTDYHAEAQKSKDDHLYQLAKDLYREYLDNFAAAPAAYKLRFNYAEILYRQKRFEDAAAQYDQVAAADPKGSLLKLAAFASVQAWEQLAESGDGSGKSGKIDKLEQGKDYSEQAIPPNELHLIDACQRFVKLLPTDVDVARVKFKAARLYFIHHHFNEAATLLAQIIHDYPHDKLARMSANLVLESFNVRSDWAQLSKYAKEFRNNRELMRDSDFVKELADYSEGSAFKEIKAQEAAGHFAEAGKAYRALANDFPKSKYAETALFNAVVIADKAQQLDLALSSAELLLRDYPEAKTRERTMFLVASFYDRVGDFERAQAAYQAYLTKYPKGSHSEDAEFNVALFEDALQKNKEALKDYERYLKDHPKAKDALPVYLKMGAIYERMGDQKNLVSHYSQLEKRFSPGAGKVFLALQKVAKANAAMKKDREATKAWQTIVDRYGHLNANERKDDQVLAALAQARFELFDPTYRSYLALKLTLPQKKMTESLVKKAKLLADIEKEYVKILAVGDGQYGIASLARLGQAYQDFSQALNEAPVPPNLSPDQQDIYVSELQNRALPIEEKAIEVYEKALEKSHELHLYNQWTERSIERLSVLKPSEHAETRTFSLVAPDLFANAAKAGAGVVQ